MFFFMFNPGAVVICIICAVLGAGGVFAFFHFKNKGKKSDADAKPTPKRILLAGLRENAEAFATLYEPLFLLASGKTDRKDYVFDAWYSVVDSIEGYDEFKAVFKKKFGEIASWKGKKKKYIKNADKLLKYVFKAGIERDDDVVVVADDTTEVKYFAIGNFEIVENAEYDVFVPYWSIETESTDENGAEIEIETILSKGAIR